jgi:tetratricopeptide (TPR) repeat protein
VAKGIEGVRLSPREGENMSGSTKMQTAAVKSRFLTDVSSLVEFADSKIVSQSGLLHSLVVSRLAQTIHSQRVLLELADKLIRLAEHYFALRNTNALEELSRALINLPIPSAQQAGFYYQALVIKPKGQPNEARLLLEAVANSGPLAYRARAIQSLGYIHRGQGQFHDALKLYIEALKAAPDKDAFGLLTRLMAHIEISIIKSSLGDHRGATISLESLFPLARTIGKHYPAIYYDFLNSLAVELGEVGRVDEAKAACSIAIASPFASAYPQWAETLDELEAKRTSATPSVVAFSQAPEVKPAPEPEQKENAASVKAVTFNWLSINQTSQRAITTIAVDAAIDNNESTRTTLDRLGKSIRTRAPPSHS